MINKRKRAIAITTVIVMLGALVIPVVGGIATMLIK